jgi:hypothetical protein
MRHENMAMSDERDVEIIGALLRTLLNLLGQSE